MGLKSIKVCQVSEEVGVNRLLQIVVNQNKPSFRKWQIKLSCGNRLLMHFQHAFLIKDIQYLFIDFI